MIKMTLREKFPYLEFFWSVFTANTRKYGPEKLVIRILFTQCEFGMHVKMIIVHFFKFGVYNMQKSIGIARTKITPIFQSFIDKLP